MIANKTLSSSSLGVIIAMEINPGQKVVVVECPQCSDCDGNSPDMTVPGVEAGQVFLVTDVCYHLGHEWPGVKLEGIPIPDPHAYLCSCTLRPIVACEPDFAEQMRALKPKVLDTEEEDELEEA